jgi:hypothetical protein
VVDDVVEDVLDGPPVVVVVVVVDDVVVLEVVVVNAAHSVFKPAPPDGHGETIGGGVPQPPQAPGQEPVIRYQPPPNVHPQEQYPQVVVVLVVVLVVVVVVPQVQTTMVPYKAGVQGSA